MSWLAGAALAAAVVLLQGPRGRPIAALSDAGRGGVRGRGAGPGGADPAAGARAGGADPTAVARAGGLADAVGRAGRDVAPRRRRRAVARLLERRVAHEPDLAPLVTDVASRLRAGADPGAAWAAVLGHPVPIDGPAVVDLSRTRGTHREAAAVVAACRLAAEIGAPLAPLLDGVAAQLAAHAEAESERRAALAGPRATARVLTWLPVLGVLLGSAVGADPVAVLLDGSIGTAALAGGVVLVLVGRAWTHRLAGRAADAGRAP